MNAILIAAGKGTRLRPLTNTTPKPLVKVLGKPMIEYSIDYLIEKGIKEIIIVVGYLGNKFSYLNEKYKEVKIVYNDKYNEYNNIYSLYVVREYLKDSYLLEGDIYLTKNIFKKDIKETTYFAKKLDYQNDEWQLKLEDNKIKEIVIGGKDNYIISGPRFFNREDSFTLKKLLEKYCESEEKKEKYFWDDVVRENIEKFDLSLIPLKDTDVYEIDNLEELKTLDKSYINIKGEN